MRGTFKHAFRVGLALCLCVLCVAACGKKQTGARTVDVTGWETAELIENLLSIRYDPLTVAMQKNSQGATLHAKDDRWSFAGVSSLHTKTGFDSQLQLARENAANDAAVLVADRTLGDTPFTVFSRSTDTFSSAVYFALFGDDAPLYGAMIVVTADTDDALADAENALATLTVI